MTGNEIISEIKSFEEKIIEDRRYLHAHAETGFDLKETVAYVRKQLEEMGYEVNQCGKAGLVVLAGGKKPGKVFLIRGDMDALPITEETDLDFKSENGCMHACGHDMHTAMLLGAARYLKNHEEDINGTIKLMFQPAEEIFQGSDDMIKSGVLENPKVDAALMIHVAAASPMEAGSVIVCSGGVSAAAADTFTIRVKGKGCHGSTPSEGIDPVTAASHIVIALQEIHGRELCIDDKAALTIGSVQGGKAANAIPDEVVMKGTIRTFDEDVRKMIKERLVEITEGTARVFRAEAEVVFDSGCPTLFNDYSLADDTFKYSVELLGKEKAFSMGMFAQTGSNKKSGSAGAGSEDFAYVSQQVPSIMLALAAGKPDEGYLYPQHNPKVKFDESALAAGTAVYVYDAMRWLEEH